MLLLPAITNLLKLLLLLPDILLMMQALPLVTSNPAAFIGISKGQLREGNDADLLILSGTADGMQLQYVFSKGQLLKIVSAQWVKRGMFE